MSVNKIKRITYLTSEMAEKRQESRTSDGAVKITRKKRYQLGIENVSLKGLNFMSCQEVEKLKGTFFFRVKLPQ